MWVLRELTRHIGGVPACWKLQRDAAYNSRLRYAVAPVPRRPHWRPYRASRPLFPGVS